jgi:alkanesulfonate monooxygenase SsuD/methylene tetrahydromethanopterin reductase-like flavin-dependent oxidoreductase (luciferase family)
VRVGVSLFFQNYADFDRHMNRDFRKPTALPDRDVYAEDLHLGDLVEPLGFDSLWTVEHHFSPYAMTASPLQLLSYFAGRTRRIELGTMVVVLPWHEPLRVAEEIALLDHFAGDRRLLLGFGRGASQLEFGPFRVDREESRQRFAESLDILRLALTQEGFDYKGQFYQIPTTTVRPRPRSSDLTRHMFCAWNSAETMALAVDAGLGQMFISLTSWESAAEQAAAFNQRRREHGWPPTAPICVVFVHCSEAEAEASDARSLYLPNMMDASIRHYEMLAAAAPLGEPGVSQLADDLTTRFTELNVVGTPRQCLDRLLAIQRLVGAGHFILVFKYGAMPVERAERSMRLFAERVLPELQAVDGPDAFSTPFGEAVASPISA